MFTASPDFSFEQRFVGALLTKDAPSVSALSLSIQSYHLADSVHAYIFDQIAARAAAGYAADTLIQDAETGAEPLLELMLTDYGGLHYLHQLVVSAKDLHVDVADAASVIRDDWTKRQVTDCEVQSCTACAPKGWVSGIRALHAQSEGLMNLQVVRQLDAVDILFAALAGDREAERVMVSLADAAQHVDAAKRTQEPMLCGSCPRPLKNNKFAFVFATPARADATAAVVLAICQVCAVDAEDIKNKAISALTGIWPDLRRVEITHPAGGLA